MEDSEKIKAIVVPSGGSVYEDAQRWSRAMHYFREIGNNTPFVIAGAGPDTNECVERNLGRSRIDYEGLDFHTELYRLFINGAQSYVGLDTISKNSIGNLTNVFPNGTSGRYAIVSYPLHLARLKMIEKRLKKKGKMSNDVELIPVSTNQNWRQTVYGLAALVKTAFDLRKI
ncbi:MAG: hypothetical protein KKB79_00990 [Nanoarchaeota archaeon]|nr:hypothetical protein [Nanoarchaeota archaeon]